MEETSYLSKVIRNPGYVLKKNFFLHPISSFSTIRRIMKNNQDMLQTASNLTLKNVNELEKYYQDIANDKNLREHLDSQFKKLTEVTVTNEKVSKVRYAKDNPAGRINMNSQENAGFFLYVLIRAIKPDIVVETGVSSGESSTYILQGLADNKKGRLYSIDLPANSTREKQDYVFPHGMSSGWAIPDHLRDRWELKLGSSKEVLLPLLEKLKTIDIFLHDSLHTYEHMMFEFQTSWEFLKKDGLLLSDDIQTLDGRGHSPLTDFADMKGKEIAVFHLVGGIRKED